MMLPNKLIWQGIKFSLFRTACSIILTKEFSDIQESDHKKFKSIQRVFFQWKPSVTVSGISTFHLNTNLSAFTVCGLVSGIWMNANQVVAFIVWWSFVSENVSTHQISHYKIFSSC